MTEQITREKLHSPVREHMRADFVQLRSDLTVGLALDLILEMQPAGRIIYFYAVDSEGRLQGVVPTRRLLLSARDKYLWQIMVKPVIAIPHDATLLEACEFFILHRLLAFPVVDEQRRIVGLVDVELYTQELSDMDRRENLNDLFQTIGVHATEARQQSVAIHFRRRFPWLLATLAGGLLTAIITDHYYDVASLAEIVVFTPLVLALAGSVTAQSVSLALHMFHGQMPTWATLWAKIKFELATGSLLGVACGLIAGMTALAWKSDSVATLSLLASIVTSTACAAALGLAMPYLFHSLKRNPRVAAGPLALASAEALTLLLYFNFARWLLG